jgi:hypothetical protein
LGTPERICGLSAVRGAGFQPAAFFAERRLSAGQQSALRSPTATVNPQPRPPGGASKSAPVLGQEILSKNITVISPAGESSCPHTAKVLAQVQPV